MAKKYNLDIIGEWWFGADLQIYIEVSSTHPLYKLK